MLETFSFEDFLKLNQHAPAWAKWPGASKEDKEKDFEIFKTLQQDIIARKPSTGHAVRFKNGDTLFLVGAGSYYQFTEIGSFYVSKGYTSYSGGFDFKHEAIQRERIGKKVGETTLECWFAHKRDLCADCAIYAQFTVPVWEVQE